MPPSFELLRVGRLDSLFFGATTGLGLVIFLGAALVPNPCCDVALPPREWAWFAPDMDFAITLGSVSGPVDRMKSAKPLTESSLAAASRATTPLRPPGDLGGSWGPVANSITFAVLVGLDRSPLRFPLRVLMDRVEGLSPSEARPGRLEAISGDGVSAGWALHLGESVFWKESVVCSLH